MKIIYILILMNVVVKNTQGLKHKLYINKPKLDTIRKSYATLAVPREIIPAEVSINDKITSIPSDLMLTPNTEIATLDGGENLGTLIWTLVLFHGLFTTSGKPCNWILPYIAKILSMNETEWFKDYSDGYSFVCPPVVDFVRFAIFIALGYGVNNLVINSFGGDSFWGWSVGICLAIPTGLINLSRDKLLMREYAECLMEIENEFDSFASENISFDEDKKTGEERIIIGFRKSCVICRSPEDFPDKVLKKIIRKKIGLKPNQGFYYGISLSSPNKRAKEALQRSLELTEKMRKQSELNEKKKKELKNVETAGEENNPENVELFG